MKYYKITVWEGKITKVKCKEHSYRWTGKMPCTGEYKCVFCGKIGDFWSDKEKWTTLKKILKKFRLRK